MQPLVDVAVTLHSTAKELSNSLQAARWLLSHIRCVTVGVAPPQDAEISKIGSRLFAEYHCHVNSADGVLDAYILAHARMNLNAERSGNLDDLLVQMRELDASTGRGNLELVLSGDWDLAGSNPLERLHKADGNGMACHNLAASLGSGSIQR